MTTVKVSIRLRNVVADVTAVMIRRGRDTAAGRRNTLGGGGTNIISIILLLLYIVGSVVGELLGKGARVKRVGGRRYATLHCEKKRTTTTATAVIVMYGATLLR